MSIFSLWVAKVSKGLLLLLILAYQTIPRQNMCLIGLHDWHLEDWSGRVCHRCDHREVLIYTAAGGAVWERVA